jgi:hypothetical protein
MVGIDNQDELELFQYLRFFQLALLSTKDNQVCQQYEGIFDLQSTQLHTLYLYHDHNDVSWVYSLEFSRSLSLESMKTMF